MSDDPARLRPTLVFVHGAFHQSWVWERVIDRLALRGWNTQTIDLPSVGAEMPTRSGMLIDADAIAKLRRRTGVPQIVIAHSYGGIPVTQVVHELPEVRHIVYVAAFQLDIGQSLLGAVGNRIPPWWIVNGDIVTADRAIDMFYNDVPPGVAAWAQKRLLPSSFAAFTEPLTAAAWRHIPSTYIVCERDVCLPLSVQEAMAQRAGQVHSLPTGHSPMLAQPEALAEMINYIALDSIWRTVTE
ncbi:alpha/beta fold hydrolase [Mycobacterium sp. 1423905.2]|uniref:alpha/beta fold hydrolase n=1 Tax=Mycobacterium sp. 1423905.2 TaxID=1856859 RepID=UPI0007FBB15E|nr:alpha/beta hydrolase [Mycobacterium sp. 1423905.2]OBJ54760.1 hypothetical protein A9W95_01405 [Mycobacterium sp. 1423905.2]